MDRALYARFSGFTIAQLSRFPPHHPCRISGRPRAVLPWRFFSVHIFRDHKRALLVFMFFAIGVPMLFFGIPWGDQGFNAGDVELARIGGVPVMASELY